MPHRPGARELGEKSPCRSSSLLNRHPRIQMWGSWSHLLVGVEAEISQWGVVLTRISATASRPDSSLPISSGAPYDMSPLGTLMLHGSPSCAFKHEAEPIPLPSVPSHPLFSLAWPSIHLPLSWASIHSGRPLLSEYLCRLDTGDQYGSSTGGLITKRLYLFAFICLPYHMVRWFPIIGNMSFPCVPSI